MLVKNFDDFISEAVLYPNPKIRVNIVFDLINSARNAVVQARYEAKVRKSVLRPSGKLKFSDTLGFFSVDTQDERKDFEKFALEVAKDLKETREYLEDIADEEIDFSVEITGSYFIERKAEKKRLEEMLQLPEMTSKGGSQNDKNDNYKNTM